MIVFFLQLKLENKTVTSKIIRIESPGSDTNTLTDRFTIEFKINLTIYNQAIGLSYVSVTWNFEYSQIASKCPYNDLFLFYIYI